MRLGIVLGVALVFIFIRSMLYSLTLSRGATEILLLGAAIFLCHPLPLPFYTFAVLLAVIDVFFIYLTELQHVYAPQPQPFLGSQRAVFAFTAHVCFAVFSFISFKPVLDAYRAFKTKQVEAAAGSPAAPAQSPTERFVAFSGAGHRIGG